MGWVRGSGRLVGSCEGAMPAPALSEGASSVPGGRPWTVLARLLSQDTYVQLFVLPDGPSSFQANVTAGLPGQAGGSEALLDPAGPSRTRSRATLAVLLPTPSIAQEPGLRPHAATDGRGAATPSGDGDGRPEEGHWH